MTKQEIISFLTEFQTIASVTGVILIPRTKTIQCLFTLRMTREEALDEILNLTYQEYSSGPEADSDPTYGGDVWIFGKQIGGNLVYIKLKIDVVAGNKVAKCLSFHCAEYPLHFPFRT